MSFTERAAASRMTLSLWTKDYLRLYPPSVLGWSTAVRVVSQVSFLALLGLFAGGQAGLSYAFVGATAHIAVLSTVVKAPDAYVEEKWQGTLYRLRLGRPGLAAVVPVRCLLYVVEAMASILLALLVAGPILGLWDLSLDMLVRFGLFLPIVISTLCFGLAVAGLSAGKRADVLAVNAASYLLMATGDVVASGEGVGWLETLQSVLPLSRGIGAMRASIAGDPWIGLALGELAVGAAWLAVAVAAFAAQHWRARRYDTDNWQ